VEWLGIFLFGVLPVFFFVCHLLEHSKEDEATDKRMFYNGILADEAKEKEARDLRAWEKKHGL
jgi:hypothetical protein